MLRELKSLKSHIRIMVKPKMQGGPRTQNECRLEQINFVASSNRRLGDDRRPQVSIVFVFHLTRSDILLPEIVTVNMPVGDARAFIDSLEDAIFDAVKDQVLDALDPPKKGD